MSHSLYLEKLSEKILAETSLIRSNFKNSTNKGNGFEVVLRNLILAYSPATNLITHGEIIDTYGNQSGQIDIAVVQNFHPRGIEDGRPNIIFYDFILAIGEAKILLDTKELKTTIKNSNSFNFFKRHAENNNLLANDFYNYENDKLPPYFLIAHTTKIAYSTIAAKVESSNISLIVALNHSKTNKGIIALGNTHRNEEVITFLDNFGIKVQDFIWESSNPILSLICALNKFGVPYNNLTNMSTYYFEL